MTDFSKNFEQYLNLYLDHQLDPEMSRQFEAYLAENPEKAAELADYQALDFTAKGELLPDLPDGYWEGLESRINTRVKQTEYESATGWDKFRILLSEKIFRFVPAVRIASLTIAILTVALVSRHFMSEFKITDMADSKPEASKIISASPVIDIAESENVEDEKEPSVALVEEDIPDLPEKIETDVKIDDKTTVPVISKEIIEDKKVQPEHMKESISLSHSNIAIREPQVKIDESPIISESVSLDQDSDKLSKQEKPVISQKDDDVVVSNRSPGDPWDKNGKLIETLSVSEPNSFSVESTSDNSSSDSVLSKKSAKNRSKIDAYQPSSMPESEIVGKSGLVHTSSVDLAQNLSESAGVVVTSDELLDDIDSMSRRPIKTKRNLKVSTNEIEVRPGEAEMEYLSSDSNIPPRKKDISELTLADFPNINWSTLDRQMQFRFKYDEEAFLRPDEIKTLYKDNLKGDDGTEIAVMEDNDLNTLDSLIFQYNSEPVVANKILLLKAVISEAFEQTAINLTSKNILRFNNLLNLGSNLNIVDSIETQEYNDSLNSLLDK